MSQPQFQRQYEDEEDTYHLVLEDGEIPAGLLDEAGHVFEEQVHIWQATEKIIRALPPELMGMTVLAFGILAFLLVFAAQGFGLLLVFTLAAVLGYYALEGEEITKEQPEFGLISRRYQLREWTQYQINADSAERLLYGGELPSAFHYPPSIIKLYDAEGDDRLQVIGLFSSTLAALWAWGLIEVRQVQVEHLAFGIRVYQKTHTLITLPSHVTSFDVEGDLEREILVILERWSNTHRHQIEAWPWRIGPTVHQLVAEVMGKRKPAGLLEIVKRNAVGYGLAEEKGWRKKFRFTSTAVKELSSERETLNLLMQRVVEDSSEWMRQLRNDIEAVLTKDDKDQ